MQFVIHFKVHRKSNKSTFTFLPSLENHGNKHWQIICILYLHRFAQAWLQTLPTITEMKNSSSAFKHLNLPPSALVQCLFIQSFFHGCLCTWTVLHLNSLLEAMGLLKHTKLFTYIENGNLQLWDFGELSISSCVFAKHHLNTCPCRCRKHHFLTALLNLLVVKPSGKNTWYKPYDLALHYKTKKKILATNWLRSGLKHKALQLWQKLDLLYLQISNNKLVTLERVYSRWQRWRHAWI